MAELNSVYDYSDKEKWTFEALSMRRQEIVRSVAGVYDDLADEQLRELAAIAGALRRRTAGPPEKAAKAKGTPKDGNAVASLF